MTAIPMTPPSMKDILGASIDSYPQNYMLPYTVLIREAFVYHRKDFLKGATFVTPGYGTLKTEGRKYVFTPLPAYRGAKGYADEISGSWG